MLQPIRLGIFVCLALSSVQAFHKPSADDILEIREYDDDFDELFIRAPPAKKSSSSKAPARKSSSSKPSSGKSSNSQAFSGMLNQYNQLQQQTMMENMEMQKAQAFWNPLESMSKKDATSRRRRSLDNDGDDYVEALVRRYIEDFVSDFELDD